MRTEGLVDALPGSHGDEDAVPPRYRSFRDWRTIVVDAYALQPTLSLTARQGQRLWGMDAQTCRYVLDGLVDAGVLTRTVDEQYCRVEYVGTVDPAGLP